jgi:hypothetical protein
MDRFDSRALRWKACVVGVDMYLEFPAGTDMSSCHIFDLLESLRGGGRVVFTGGIRGCAEDFLCDRYDKSLWIRGRCMYERKDVLRLIKMVESGNGGARKGGGYQEFPCELENVEEALCDTEANSGWIAGSS